MSSRELESSVVPDRTEYRTADVISLSLQSENQLLRTQLQSLATALKQSKLENRRITEQLQQYAHERAHYESCTLELKSAKEEVRDLHSRIAVLEAEIERVASESESAALAQEEAEHKAKLSQEAFELATVKLSNAESEVVSASELLETLLHQVYSLTRSLFPSFEAPDITEKSLSSVMKLFNEAIAFLEEVFKARTEASAMIREKMKAEQLELKAKISVAARKETLLTESLRMAEDNAAKEKLLLGEMLEEVKQQGEQEKISMEKQFEQVRVDAQTASRETEEQRALVSSLERDLKESKTQVTAAEEVAKKESAARRHLQRLLSEEQAKCRVAERHVKEMKLQLKLCGTPGGVQLSQADLVDIVTRLTGEQGALELENCALRDRLLAACSELGEGSDADSLQDHIEAALGSEAGDVALAEALLQRRKGSRAE